MRVFFLTVFLLLVLALGALEAIASRSLPIDPLALDVPTSISDDWKSGTREPGRPARELN